MTLEVPHIKYNVQGLGDALEKHQLETVIGATTSNADSDSSSDEEEIVPTPAKKPAGIERLQRGRKIKPTSPAGRN
jgi:hypothetical protein